jgi:hypothetical protein
MQKVLGLVVALLFFLHAPAARAERDLLVPFHEAGHLVFDQLSGVRLGAADGFSYAGPLGFASRTTRIGTTTTDTTSVWIAPSADVFVTDHLSLGALVEIGHTWGSHEQDGEQQALPGTSSVVLLPRAGFYVPFGDRFGVWPRAGLGYRATATFQSMVLDVDVSVVYRFTEHFFLRAGPEIALTLGGKVNGAADGSIVQISGVFGFGVNLEP